MPELTVADRDKLGPVVAAADGFVHAYYGGDSEWDGWLADLRVACRRLDEAEAAELEGQD